MARVTIVTDLSRHDPELDALRDRLLAYRRLVKNCPHIDGARHGPGLEVGYWQCMSCGLVETETKLKELERWPEPAREPENEALGTALAGWEGP